MSEPTTTTRDPRTDPQKGDVVRDGNGFFWQVMARKGDSLRVKIDYARRGEWWALDRWHTFAAINDVTHTAPPPRPSRKEKPCPNQT